MFNIIHDCDEVYNYWEPLHYLLYGYGKQTWEYRCVDEQVQLVGLMNLLHICLVVSEGRPVPLPPSL